jgi:hypothetical protein
VQDILSNALGKCAPLLTSLNLSVLDYSSITKGAGKLSRALPLLNSIYLEYHAAPDRYDIVPTFIPTPTKCGDYEVIRGSRPELLVHYELTPAQISSSTQPPPQSRSDRHIHIRFIQEKASCWWAKGPYRIDLSCADDTPKPYRQATWGPVSSKPTSPQL